MNTTTEQLHAGDNITWGQQRERLKAIGLQVCRLKASTFNEQDVEDIVSVCAMKLINKFLLNKGVDWEDYVKQMKKACENAIKDLMRKRAAEKNGANKVDGSDVLEDVAVTSYELCPSEFTVHRELQEKLAPKNGGQSSRYLSIVRDHFFDGIRHRDLAPKYGISVKSVGVYIRRGLDELGQLYGSTSRQHYS